MAEFEINIKCPECGNKGLEVIPIGNHDLIMHDDVGDGFSVCVESRVLYCYNCSCDFVVSLSIHGNYSTQMLKEVKHGN